MMVMKEMLATGLYPGVGFFCLRMAFTDFLSVAIDSKGNVYVADTRYFRYM